MKRAVLAPLAFATSVVIGLGGPLPNAHAKSVFDADPGQRGLLVADLKIRQKTLFQTVEGSLQHGAVVRMDEPAANAVGCNPTSGLLVFAVEPGQWRLAGALATVRVGSTEFGLDIRFPVDSLPELTRRVEAGTVVYIGQVESKCTSRMVGGKFNSSMSYDRERETKVLEKLQGKAKNSPWAERIATHLAELKAGMSEAAAPADSTARTPKETAPPDSTAR